MPYQVRQLAFGLGLNEEAAQKGFSEARDSALSRISSSKEDCSIAEINPIDHHRRGRRHRPRREDQLRRQRATSATSAKWEELRDLSEEAPTETEAKAAGLSYIQLDGNDRLPRQRRGPGDEHDGHHPALSAASPRTSSTSAAAPRQEAVTKAFRSSSSPTDVKGIFVNIFGGIMRCDIIANGVVAATKELGLERPARRPPRRDQRRAGQGHPRRRAA